LVCHAAVRLPVRGEAGKESNEAGGGISLPCSRPIPSPLGAMVDDPIGQSAFEADVKTSFLGFDPFVLEDLATLGLKFTIQGRVSNEVAASLGI